MERFIALFKMLFTCGLFLVLVGFVILRQDEIKTIMNTYLV